MSKAKICRNCTHWQAKNEDRQHGECHAITPHGKLLEKAKAQHRIFVFPLVREDDFCPSFSPRPSASEAPNPEQCVERIVEALETWHHSKGDSAFMPGWLFNRKLKGFPTQIQKSAKQILTGQGRLLCKPLVNNGKSGLVYGLTPVSREE